MYLDAMVGKAEHREKHCEREEMVYYVFLGLLRFCVGFNFNFNFFNIMLTWKIVRASEASVIYIYIY